MLTPGGQELGALPYGASLLRLRRLGRLTPTRTSHFMGSFYDIRTIL